jgi:hypothetical protein
MGMANRMESVDGGVRIEGAQAARPAAPRHHKAGGIV